MRNYLTECYLANHETWRNDLIIAIESFKAQYNTLPSYILANSHMHSLLDMWANSSETTRRNNLTHFIVDGNYIHLVYDSSIKDEFVQLQYDAFFELENIRHKTVVRKQKKRVAA